MIAASAIGSSCWLTVSGYAFRAITRQMAAPMALTMVMAAKIRSRPISGGGEGGDERCTGEEECGHGEDVAGSGHLLQERSVDAAERVVTAGYGGPFSWSEQGAADGFEAFGGGAAFAAEGDHVLEESVLGQGFGSLGEGACDVVEAAAVGAGDDGVCVVACGDAVGAGEGDVGQGGSAGRRGGRPGGRPARA
ncbi:hypothetical protein LRS58_19000 [Rhodococcus sp. BH2-1]|nr:hypothetical protein [Rhodococcus sp. BH2-1]